MIIVWKFSRFFSEKIIGGPTRQRQQRACGGVAGDSSGWAPALAVAIGQAGATLGAPLLPTRECSAGGGAREGCWPCGVRVRACARARRPSSRPALQLRMARARSRPSPPSPSPSSRLDRLGRASSREPHAASELGDEQRHVGLGALRCARAGCASFSSGYSSKQEGSNGVSSGNSATSAVPTRGL
jgi:hypothetical protein